MKSQRLWIWASILCILAAALVFARWQKIGSEMRGLGNHRKLVVMAYDTFAGVGGPAKELVDGFAQQCGCEVELLKAGEAGLLLEKLALMEKNLKIDVVLGMDQLLRTEAEGRFQWREIDMAGTDWDSSVQEMVGSSFIPLDWAPLTFIYREGETTPPKDTNDLLDSRFVKSLSLPDPRTSSPGQQFLLAVVAWQGAGGVQPYLEGLTPNIFAVAPSWSTAYGLFQRGEAKVAFSYLTSVIYHWQNEKNQTYRYVSLPEGHPWQVEYAAIPAGCAQCELAEEFVRYLLTAESQRKIMEKNFMFPVIKGVKEGTAFAQLPELSLLSPAVYKHFLSDRDKWLAEWQKSVK